VVEYGDFECPYCGRAEPAVRDLLRDFADVGYVWRHLPLADMHPNAELAAEASEAATAQGAFWPMHDLLLKHQDALGPADLMGYADQLGLDVERFTPASPQARRCPPNRRGRRGRRPQRRLRHPDLLHQRAPPLRRLRHRRPLGRRPCGRRPGELAASWAAERRATARLAPALIGCVGTTRTA